MIAPFTEEDVVLTVIVAPIFMLFVTVVSIAFKATVVAAVDEL